MDFDVCKVYTAINADELKVGSKVLVSDCISGLKDQVTNYKDGDARELIDIRSESSSGGRFETRDSICHLAYLIAEPEEKYLKWTDLELGDIVTNGNRSYIVTGIDKEGKWGSHISFGFEWMKDDDLKGWWKKVKDNE